MTGISQSDQKRELDILFKNLKSIGSRSAAMEIEQKIWDIWNETNDINIEADFYRGLESMRTGDLLMAIAFFTRVIEKKPNMPITIGPMPISKESQ